MCECNGNTKIPVCIRDIRKDVGCKVGDFGEDDLEKLVQLFKRYYTFSPSSQEHMRFESAQFFIDQTAFPGVEDESWSGEVAFEIILEPGGGG